MSGGIGGSIGAVEVCRVFGPGGLVTWAFRVDIDGVFGMADKTPMVGWSIALEGAAENRDLVSAGRGKVFCWDRGALLKFGALLETVAGGDFESLTWEATIVEICGCCWF